MNLLIKVNSTAYDTAYGGEQTLPAEKGEYLLSKIFRLPFFRVIIDDVIDGAVCFRLKEGAEDHFFVLERIGEVARFGRETSIGSDDFSFELVE